MATILSFRASERSRSIAPAGGAEIIIFPGIRYEYWAPADAEPKRTKAKPRKGRRKRAAR
jgi:hypothetical protein